MTVFWVLFWFFIAAVTCIAVAKTFYGKDAPSDPKSNQQTSWSSFDGKQPIWKIEISCNCRKEDCQSCNPENFQPEIHTTRG
jgi:hypothetical protein